MIVFNSFAITILFSLLCIYIYIKGKYKNAFYLILAMYFVIGAIDGEVKNGKLQYDFIYTYWDNFHIAVSCGFTVVVGIMIVQDIRDIKERRRKQKNGEKTHLNDGKEI